MKRLFGFLTILFLGIPAIAWSQSFDLTPAPTDQSVEFLSYVFGVVNGVLHGSGSQIMGKMFAQFNSAILALGGIVLVYTTLMGVMNTAQEGEFLGKKFSSVFVPFRTLTGILLIAPTSTGYSWIQIFVIWIVLQGVGAANAVWNAALNYLYNGGVIIAQNQDVVNNPLAQSVRGQMTNLASATACLNALQGAINQVTFSGGKLPPPRQEALASVIDSINPNSATPIGTVPLPNFAQDDKPWVGLNGICGSISNIAAGNNVDAQGGGGTVASSGYDGYVALRQAILDMSSGTENIVGNTCDANCYAQQKDASGQPIPGQYAPTTCPSGTYLPSSGANCGTASKCTPNGIPGDNTQPNNYFYFNAYSIAQPILSWCNNVNFAGTPNLNQTFNFAVTDYVGLRYSNVSSNPFLSPQAQQAALESQLDQAKAAGWFNAGSYYFTLTSLNANAQNGSTTVNDGGFKVNPPAASAGACSSQASGKFTMDDNFIDCYLKNAPTPVATYSAEPMVPSLQTYENSFFTWLLPFFGESKGGQSGTFSNNLLSQFVSGQIGAQNYGHQNTNGAVDDSSTGGFTGDVIGDLVTSGMAISSDIATMQNAQANGVNPVMLMMNLGAAMMNTALNAWITIALIAFGVSFALGAAISFTFSSAIVAVMAVLAPLVSAILIPMFVAGAVLTYYLPMVPFMIFSFGVIGWIIGVIEAMIAAPIVGFGILNPEGHDLWGKADPAVMLLLNLFLRPSLMIFGLISGIMVSYIGIWIINNGIGSVNSVINSVGGGEGDAMIYGVAMPIIYMIICMQIINKSFTLIYMFPDRITRWLSGGLQESLGSEMSGLEEKARGMAQGTAGRLGEGIGGSSRATTDKANAAQQRAQQKHDGQQQGSGTTISGGGTGGNT